MKAAPIVSAAITFLCITLLGESAASAEKQTLEYFPRTLGMEFEMDVELTDRSGHKRTGRVFRKFTERIERNGKVFLKMRTWTDGTPFEHDVTKLTRRDETGLYVIDDEAPNLGEQREAVLPLSIGNSWRWESRIGTIKSTVITNETVSIGPRIFENCFLIRTETLDRSYVEDVWEAPGIGAVQSVARTGRGVISITLRKFKKA